MLFPIPLEIETPAVLTRIYTALTGRLCLLVTDDDEALYIQVTDIRVEVPEVQRIEAVVAAGL
jgi:hypothetical protein